MAEPCSSPELSWRWPTRAAAPVAGQRPPLRKRTWHWLKCAGGRLLVVFAAVLYGSYTPTLAIIFASAKRPSVSAISFARAVLIAASFVPVLLRAVVLSWHALTVSMVLSAIEVAVYDVGMMSLLNLGLGLNGSPTKAAYLLQSSILFTPCISALCRRPVPRRAWFGSLLALVGAALVTTSETQSASHAGMNGSFKQSHSFVEATDVIFVLAALCYSLYVYRQGRLVQSGEPASDTWLRQALCNLFSLVPFGAWFGAEVLVTQRGLREQWPGMTSLDNWVLVIVSALSVGVIGQTLQAIGQRRTPIVEANIILATEPLWATLFAATLLDEWLSATGWLGGVIMLFACLVGAPFCGAAPIGPVCAHASAKSNIDDPLSPHSGYATSSSAASVEEGSGAASPSPATNDAHSALHKWRHSRATQH